MDATYDGGGWTLAAVSSDDGQDTWTWNNRHYWDTDTTVFGSLDELNKDYKSIGLHSLVAEEMLFIHSPSTIWALYPDITSTGQSLSEIIEDIGGPADLIEDDGFPISDGTFLTSDLSSMCSTNLFFNANDLDTSPSEDSYGPVWSAEHNNGCPFDDPAISSLGPDASAPTVEVWSGHEEAGTGFGTGFGWALDLNTGTSSAAENYMWVLVRRGEEEPALSCLDILESGYSTGDGTYWIDPDGTGAFEAYCDMTTDGGGWTAFFTNTNGASNVFDYFENNTVNCTSPASQCMRPLPNTVDTSYGLGIRCDTTMISAAMNSDLVDYFQNGTQHQWVTLSGTSIIDGSLDADIEAFWTGTEGLANPGWMVGQDGTVSPNPSTTFASSYLDPAFDYCNATPDMSSTIHLFYR
jgi:hypothetical protein